MSDILHDKIKGQLVDAVKRAESLKFWRDARRVFASSVFKIGLIASVLFAVDLAHRGEWRPFKTLVVGFTYAALLGLATAWSNRTATRREILHERGRRVFVVRKPRESAKDFERRIALQEQMADRP